MSDFEEPSVDLGPLKEEARLRAERIAHGVLERIAARPASAGLRHLVQAHLARAAIPGLLAVAASLAAVVLTRPGEPEPDRFAVLILGPGPARAWITLKREPDVAEVMALLRDAR